MKTEQIFRKIYQELKEQVSNNNDVFLKEYTIPSINYDPDNENIDNKYFASGIVIELDRMMVYFFSNSEEKTKERMITEINKDMPKDNTSKEELLLCESVQYPMEDTIDIIVENYEKNKFQKNEHLLIDKIL